MSKLSNNDKAWSLLFEHFDIINKIKQDGQFEVTANEIKEIGKREPRLMAKFDSHAELPQLFQKNELSILPITRGSYIIAPFEAYHRFPKKYHDDGIIYVAFPEHIESIDANNINSEIIAINSAYLSGILKDFIGDDGLIPTVSGRMSSNAFSFNINNISANRLMQINVQNSQIEIDAAYEGESLVLIEAKNNILSDDFLIRQMYYPFRRWQDQLRKKVKTVFIVYTNSVFYLYEYKFEDITNYNSLILSKFQRYSFEPLNIELSDIEKLLSHTTVIDEPVGLPFPQADKFSRIINLCELLYSTPMTKGEITSNYDFVSRQSAYYSSSGEYLGLFYGDGEQMFLTEKGENIFRLSPRARQLEFVKLIIQHRVFNLALKSYFEKSQPPTRETVVEIMKTCGLNKVGTNEEYANSTYGRRAGTVIGWVNWILALAR